MSIFCIIKSIESTGMAETMMSMVQTEIAHNLSVFKGWLGNLRSRFGSGECEAAGRRLDKDILGKETQSTSCCSLVASKIKPVLGITRRLNKWRSVEDSEYNISLSCTRI